ncbi:MAG: trypsin-like peptidase domain-containing protein [Planctomycetota bacterium]
MCACLVLVLALRPAGVWAKGGVRGIEKEFRAAIRKASSAAVTCVPSEADEKKTGLGSSGVIVTRSGFVLSDGDVGVVTEGRGKEARTSYRAAIDVRVPDLGHGGFKTYRARVVRRVRAVDTTLLQIVDPPAGGFPDFLVPGSSADLQIGDFLFVTGNSWGAAREAPPATTAGVVASIRPLPPDDGGGRHEFVYTSAAVNPGVNGGPVVDVEGRLVGTVSSFLPPDPGEPFQFLGKVMPMDRIRAVYTDLPQAAEVFPPPVAQRQRAPVAAALETAYRTIARRTYRSVVSLDVEREKPLSVLSPGTGGIFPVPRYLGPVSGILVDGDGWIVTSLYNLTNIAELVFCGAGLPLWRAPPPDRVEAGLAAVKKVTVYLPTGGKAKARLVAHDSRLGIVLLKADLQAMKGTTAAPSDAPVGVPPGEFGEGRFALAIGNPFGAARNPDPFLTVGILSKPHADTLLRPWRGDWQTDVNTTDANCGGAVVDLKGRLLGMLHIWSPPLFGRNSGIAFLVPWYRIEASLESLKKGESPRRGWLGVRLEPGNEVVRIAGVEAGSPAAEAGLDVGDRVVAIDGLPVAAPRNLLEHLASRWEGETLVFTVQRGGKRLEMGIVLGARKTP